MFKGRCRICFVMILLLFVSCGQQQNTTTVLRPATGTYETLGSILPCIRIGDRIFYWCGAADHVDKGTVADRIENSNHKFSVLPDGFLLSAPLRHVHLDDPVNNYEFAADFMAEGEIFENPDCPDVIYVKLRADRQDEAYIRFTTEQLGNGDRISYGGELYKITWQYFLSLPNSYELGGQLQAVGCDNLPQTDFETTYPFDGQNVYVSSTDSTHIYVENLVSGQPMEPVFYECVSIEAG